MGSTSTANCGPGSARSIRRIGLTVAVLVLTVVSLAITVGAFQGAKLL